jgi:hypothetical protein
MPHFGGVVFIADGNMFASCAKTVVVFEPVAEMRDVLAGDPRCTPYPRDKRALVMDVSGPTDWNLVKQLVFDSYGLHVRTHMPPAKLVRITTSPKKPTKKPAKKPTKKPAATSTKRPATRSTKKPKKR